MKINNFARLAEQAMFYLIFLVAAAMAFGMLGFYGWAVGSWTAMRFWPEVPAQVRRVELEQTICCKASVRVVRAEYTYEWRGKAHTGSRVFAQGECEHPPSMTRAAHAEIASRSGDRSPFRCYVNPLNPRQAVLYRYASVSMVFLSTFFALCVGVFFAAVVSGHVKAGKDRWCQRRHPEEPWRWRAEWETGVVPSCREGSVSGAVLQAFVFNLLCLSVLPVALLDTWDGNSAAAKLLVFPVIGAGVALWAARRALRWQRGWATVFEMDTLPAEVGGTLAGRARVRAKRPPDDGAVAVLACSRWDIAAARKNGVKQCKTLWQGTFFVPQDKIGRDGPMTVVPVRLRIPSDLPPVVRDQAGLETEWKLHVALGVSAHDPFADFVLPVSPGPKNAPAAEAGAEIAECLPMEPHDILRAAKIQMDALPEDGVALTFPKVRTPWAALAGSVILVSLVAMVTIVALVAEEITWDELTLLVALYAVMPAVIPLFWLFSRCRRPRRIAVNREGVSLPGGLLRLRIRRRLRLDKILGIAVTLETDAISRTSEVFLVTRGSEVLAANRLSYPAALAVQRVLETAIKDYAGKTT